MSEHILVMAKRPEIGKVKTRLAAGIGAELALEVYQRLLCYTLDELSTLPVDRRIFWTGSGSFAAPEWLSEHEQVKGDLGMRMLSAFMAVEKECPKQKKIMIGTDCPELSAEHLAEALRLLDDHDVVIGPSQDGGYYLIGMKLVHTQLFEEIPWSTHEVLHRTRGVLSSSGLRWKELPSLNDVDVLADLQAFRNKEIFRDLDLNSGAQ